SLTPRRSIASWRNMRNGPAGPARAFGFRSHVRRELGRKRHGACSFPHLMSPLASARAILDQESRDFYRDALGLLDDEKLPYLVGGAYAFARYTGIERHTKDFDIFIRHSDFARASKILGRAGYETDLSFPHWLGKAFKGENFIDLIFSAGNGVAVVDD